MTPGDLRVSRWWLNWLYLTTGSMTNRLGRGFRTPGRPYYNMLSTNDRPKGMAFYHATWDEATSKWTVSPESNPAAMAKTKTA